MNQWISWSQRSTTHRGTDWGTVPQVILGEFAEHSSSSLQFPDPPGRSDARQKKRDQVVTKILNGDQKVWHELSSHHGLEGLIIGMKEIPESKKVWRASVHVFQDCNDVISFFPVQRCSKVPQRINVYKFLWNINPCCFPFSSALHLVGGLEHVFPNILGISSSHLVRTPWFFRGVGSTTNQTFMIGTNGKHGQLSQLHIFLGDGTIGTQAPGGLEYHHAHHLPLVAGVVTVRNIASNGQIVGEWEIIRFGSLWYYETHS